MRHQGAVGPLLVFEPGVVGAVAVRRAAVTSMASPSDATAPTAIPKRNTTPIDPCDVDVQQGGAFGQLVGRPCRRICEVVPTPLANALAYDKAGAACGSCI